jgi:hypothetical protein
VVEPPPDPAEQAKAEARISSSTLLFGVPRGDADVAAYLQSLLGRGARARGARTAGPARGADARDPSLVKVLPYALLKDEGFMNAFNGTGANSTYTVNADTPAQSYVLVAGGVYGPASTLYVLKLDPVSGALRQATWNREARFFPPVSPEAAAWLGRPAGHPDAVLASADLVYDPASDRSPFFPRWRLRYTDAGQTLTGFVAQAQAASLAGDSDNDGMNDGDELYAGLNPADRNSVLAAEGSRVSTNTSRLVVEWASTTDRTYGIDFATNLVRGFTRVRTRISATPPTNREWFDVPQGVSYFRVVIE